MPFPAIELTLVDGSRQRWDTPADALMGWPSVSRGVLELRFVPDNGLQFTGCSDYWVYTPAPNEYIFGALRPALDVGTPNEVSQTLTELRFHRNGTLLGVQYPVSIPPSAIVRRWPHG